MLKGSKKKKGKWRMEKGMNLKRGLFQLRRFPLRKASMPILEEFWIPFYFLLITQGNTHFLLKGSLFREKGS